MVYFLLGPGVFPKFLLAAGTVMMFPLDGLPFVLLRRDSFRFSFEDTLFIIPTGCIRLSLRLGEYLLSSVVMFNFSEIRDDM